MKLRIWITVILIAGICAAAVGPAWAPDAFAEGLELFNAGKWLQAAERLSAAAAKNPSDAAVSLTAGVALANIKRYDDALKLFSRTARQSAAGVLPYLLLEGIYSETGDAARAREARDQAARILNSGRAFGGPASSDSVLMKSLVKYPSNAIAHCLLGDLYQLQGKLESAKDHYVKASELAPEWAKPVFNLGLANLRTDPKAAEKNFDRAIKLDPSNRRIFLWQGDAYLEQGRFGDAIRAYRYAAQDKDLEPEANTRIGNAELRAGNYAAAEEEFGRAAQQAPQDPRPIAGQAQVLQNVGRLKEAEAKYSLAAEVMASNQAAAPSRAVVQQQIAAVRAQQGRIEEAINSLKLGYELHPTVDSARELALAQQRAGRLPESIAEFEAVLKKDPASRSALVYLLCAYALTGNATGAASAAERLIAIDPANTRRYHEETGAAYFRAGSAQASVEAYMRAINAGNAETWPQTARHAKESGALSALKERCEKAFKAGPKRSTGIVLFELHCAAGDVAGMLEVADRLVKLYPDDAALWLRLGLAHEQAGNKELAALAYTRAASSADPEVAGAARARAEALGK